MGLACLLSAALASLAGRRGPLPCDSGPLPWPEGRAAGGRLVWKGVAAAEFTFGGTTLAFDPFVTRPGMWRVVFGRPEPDRELVAAHFAHVDAVFVGHAHYDHTMDLPAVMEAAPHAVLHGDSVVIELARRWGLPEARLRLVHPGDEVGVGPFRVRVLAAAHGRVPLVGFLDRVELRGRGLPRTPLCFPRGTVLAYHVEAGGRRFHVQGSAGIDEAGLAASPPADALLACLAARAGTPKYLERLVEHLKPSVFVPIHHDNLFLPLSRPPTPVPTLRWESLIAETEQLRAAHGTQTFLPPRNVPIPW